MNILFVSCTYRLFDNIDCGASNRSTMLVKALSRIGHVDIISFSKDKIISKHENCEILYSNFVPQTKRKDGKIRNNIRWIVNPKSIYSYYTKCEEREKIVDRFNNEKEYDIIACRYIEEATSCGLFKYKKKLVVDVDDNLTSAFKRTIGDIQNANFFKKLFVTWKTNSISAMSVSFLSQIKHSFYSNLLEPPYRESVYLHNVSVTNTEITDITKTTPKRMLIVGWLDFLPNKFGVLHFVQNVFPKIREQDNDAELVVVGKCKDKKFIDYLNGISGVNAVGFVKNISDVYLNCRIVVIPVYQGSGTSVKFAEGLMMNRPMVSTPMGVRGFEHLCKSDEHYLLAMDDIQFAEKVHLLLNNSEASKRIARNARKVGNANFSQYRFFQIVEETLTK